MLEGKDLSIERIGFDPYSASAGIYAENFASLGAQFAKQRDNERHRSTAAFCAQTICGLMPGLAVSCVRLRYKNSSSIGKDC
mmetsp:Transcript_78272/g.153648  ORF Transcript_78272/g.153648 Transcript_78272/m.153648 type:complete len:82 (+) Transcript_78272:117-362(+)